jgi:hypothetical protein
LIEYTVYGKIYEMSELLVTRLLIAEDGAYIRQERLAGDPSREPDETTLEDVTEALLRREATPAEILRDKDICTRMLRIMLKSVDQQG